MFKKLSIAFLILYSELKFGLFYIMIATICRTSFGKISLHLEEEVTYDLLQFQTERSPKPAHLGTICQFNV